MFSTRKTAAAAPLVIACVAVASAGAMAGSAGDDRAGQPGAPSSDRPVVVSTPPEQASAFALLRRSEQAGDALRDRGPGPFGANLSLARAVNTPIGTVRLVPANGMLCLRAEDDEGSMWTCVTPDAAKAGRLALSVRDESGGLVSSVGVLPDGYGGAHGLSGRDESSPVTTSQGVYTVTSADVTAVEYTGPSGEKERVTLP